ncbi:MAG: ABC transporter substrate-binding protein [Patescibacteria group bacterium]
MDSKKNKIFSIFSALKASFSFNGIKGLFYRLPGMKKDAARAQDEIDKKLVYSMSRSRVPSLRQVKYIKMYLSPKEGIVMKVCLAIIFFNLLFLGGRFYKNHLKVVPKIGGEYREGLVGSPKYINPLFASTNDVDSDISQLVFSSLFKRDNEGKITGDLAENYKVSPDGKKYSLKIRSGAKWHNGNDLTVDDIVFTFGAIKDSEFKSTLHSSFGGVEIEKIDEENISFNLSEPYAPFIELLTFGILPRDIWEQIPPASARLAELNLKPIGSGPYRFKSLLKDKNGNIKAVNLSLNEDYYGKKPYIKELTFSFFPNYEEMVAGINGNQIDGMNYLPPSLMKDIAARDSYNLKKINLPQLTALFFNPANNAFLADKRVRKALALAMPKEEIMKGIFNQDDYKLIYSPISSDTPYYFDGVNKYGFNFEAAAKGFIEAGWKIEEINEEAIRKAGEEKESEDAAVRAKAEAVLEQGAGKWLKNEGGKYFNLKITTVESEDNSRLAEAIRTNWEKAGIKVIVELIPAGQIQSQVRAKSYESLLYGITLGPDPDCYAYWHSTQAEKGLNLANYSNKTVDALLEDGRVALDAEIRKGKYKQFQEIISDEEPAIFIYSPFYNYIQDKKIKNSNTVKIYNPSDRFSGISEWYIKTEKKIVW